MIFKKRPTNFNPNFEVSACFILFKKKFIFLKTGLHKKLAGLWGVPAGKLNFGETPLECVKREILEETQINLNENETKFFKTIYIKYPEIDYIYHIFYTKLKEKPEIIINSHESEEYKWVNKKEALQMPLIPDEGPCIEMFFKEINKKNYFPRQKY